LPRPYNHAHLPGGAFAMTRRPITNVAASVRDRLLNRSRQTGEDFQFLLQRYAAERLLYRLGQAAHRDRFVPAGTMLFALWDGLLPVWGVRRRDLPGRGRGVGGHRNSVPG